MIKRLVNRIHVLLRSYYENRINLPFGIASFIGNIAFVQLNRTEFLTINSPSKRLSDLTVTTHDMRPLLRYSYWPKEQNWQEGYKPPVIETIVEIRGFQVRELGASDWDLVTIEDPRVEQLKDMFLGFAFYQPLRAGHKQKLLEVVSAQQN